VNRSKCCLGSD